MLAWATLDKEVSSLAVLRIRRVFAFFFPFIISPPDDFSWEFRHFINRHCPSSSMLENTLSSIQFIDFVTLLSNIPEGPKKQERMASISLKVTPLALENYVHSICQGPDTHEKTVAFLDTLLRVFNHRKKEILKTISSYTNNLIINHPSPLKAKKSIPTNSVESLLYLLETKKMSLIQFFEELPHAQHFELVNKLIEHVETHKNPLLAQALKNILQGEVSVFSPSDELFVPNQFHWHLASKFQLKADTNAPLRLPEDKETLERIIADYQNPVFNFSSQTSFSFLDDMLNALHGITYRLIYGKANSVLSLYFPGNIVTRNWRDFTSKNEVGQNPLNRAERLNSFYVPKINQVIERERGRERTKHINTLETILGWFKLLYEVYFQQEKFPELLKTNFNEQMHFQIKKEKELLLAANRAKLLKDIGFGIVTKVSILDLRDMYQGHSDEAITDILEKYGPVTITDLEKEPESSEAFEPVPTKREYHFKKA